MAPGQGVDGCAAWVQGARGAVGVAGYRYKLTNVYYYSYAIDCTYCAPTQGCRICRHARFPAPHQKLTCGSSRACHLPVGHCSSVMVVRDIKHRCFPE